MPVRRLPRHPPESAEDDLAGYSPDHFMPLMPAMPLMSWPAIGCDMRMFHIRPIAPAGGRRRKKT